jgi:hypothetical protein
MILLFYADSIKGVEIVTMKIDQLLKKFIANIIQILVVKQPKKKKEIIKLAKAKRQEIVELEKHQSDTKDYKYHQ